MLLQPPTRTEEHRAYPRAVFGKMSQELDRMLVYRISDWRMLLRAAFAGFFKSGHRAGLAPVPAMCQAYPF
jgi:hypothetical protein